MTRVEVKSHTHTETPPIVFFFPSRKKSYTPTPKFRMTFPFSDCARPLGCRRRKNRAACNFPSTETRVAAAAKGLDLCDTRSEIAVPNFYARLTHTHGTVHGCVTPHGLSLALSLSMVVVLLLEWKCSLFLRLGLARYSLGWRCPFGRIFAQLAMGSGGVVGSFLCSTYPLVHSSWKPI